MSYRRAVRRLPALVSLLSVPALAAALVGPAQAAGLDDPDHAGRAPAADTMVGAVERADPGSDLLARRGGGTITLRGHGNGHGRGMSQYGAKGAAEDGLSYRRIISFYYPHTSWHEVGGPIEVLVTADTSRDLVVRDRDGLAVRKVGTRAWTPLAAQRPSATRWRVLEGAGNRSLVDYRTGQGGWQRQTVVAGDAELSAGGKALRVLLPQGDAAYRGILRSVTPQAEASEGRRDRDTVNVVSLDDYLRGVVPLEMPALWSREAVKAQAVAARSYAVWKRAHPVRTHYDICDTSSCQVYGGVDAEHPASNAAVRATSGRARFAAGGPAFTEFSASNGGWTVKGGFPYQVAKRDPHEAGSGNPYATWTRTISTSTIASSYGVGSWRGIDLLDRDGHGEWNGRVGQVRVRGSGGSRTVSADDFRVRFGLPSTWFVER